MVNWRACEILLSSRRRHTRYWRDWSSDVCSSDLGVRAVQSGAFTLGDLLLVMGYLGLLYGPLNEISNSKANLQGALASRSEERRVGKERRSRWSPHH